jgi:dTDP-4-amino-4,6-dideoxygalactose transaminase
VARSIASAVADGSWGRYDAGHVAMLESDLARFHDLKFVQTCSSGTLAVEIALQSIGVGAGDDVLLAAYDYEGNFLSIHAVGARPVLIDVAPRNWNFDPRHIEAALNTRVKAIVVSHLHGGIVPMEEVMAIACRHGLSVIEDAAQCPGARVQGRPAGSWGDIGVLSFGGSKLLSAGRGGALLTRHAHLYQKARVALRRGFQQWAALSEIQAAALIPQLAKLAEHHARRRDRVQLLKSHIRDVPGMQMLENDAGESDPAYYKVGFQFDPNQFGLSRARFVAAVRAEGIAMDEGFRAAHMGRAASRFHAAGELAEATKAHHGMVMLHHPILLGTDADVIEVARAVAKVYLNAHRLSA